MGEPWERRLITPFQERSLPDWDRQIGNLPVGAGEVLVAYDGRLLGALEIDDVLRPEAAEAVTRMRGLGMTVVLLTGDHKRIAEKVAQQLAVQDFAAELLPEQKLRRIEELKRGGSRVVMVGDG